MPPQEPLQAPPDPSQAPPAPEEDRFARPPPEEYGPPTRRTVTATGESAIYRQNLRTQLWEKTDPFGLGKVTGFRTPPNIPLSTRFKLGFATTPEQIGSLEPEVEEGAPGLARKYLGPPSEFIGHMPELVGMGVGGVIGAALKMPVKVGIPLAGVGATAGKGFQQFVGEEILGLPPATPEEGASQRRGALARGMGYEALGVGAAWFYRGGFLAESITPAGAAGRRWVAEQNFPPGVSLTPSQVSDKGWADIAENVAGAGFMGSQLPMHVKTTSEAISARIRQWFTQFGRLIPSDKLGRAALETMDAGYNKAIGPASAMRAQMYKEAMTAGPEGGQLLIPMSHLRSAYQTLRNDALGSTELGVQVLNKLERTGVLTPGRTAGGQFQRQQSVGLETAVDLRTLLGDVWAKARNTDNRQLAGKAARLLREVDTSVKSSLKEVGLLQSFNRQLAIYRGARARFETDLLKQLTKRATRNPDAFIRSLSGVDRVTLAKQLNKALKGTQELKDLKRAVLEDIWRDSLAQVPLEVGEKLTAETVGAAGAQAAIKGQADLLLREPTLSLGHRLARKAFHKSGYGREFMETWFDKETISFIDNAANALRVQQAKQLTGVGAAAIQFAQVPALMEAGGAVAGLNSLRFAGSAIIVGPKFLSWVATSPRMQKWLLDGLTTPAGTAEGIAIMAGMMGEIARRPEIIREYTEELAAEARSIRSGSRRVGESIGLLAPSHEPEPLAPPSESIGQ